eukprot:TRINITY_DN4674_c0_g1_i2.p1 TRINITY_DN4674_c0_g1~~TRINITY_DN4674_c0_g1_i2.p1  ORF type:complete len:156 (+),score=5.30 TRINITY_DN4674_c0_g1_i2:551-1018(+)
MFLDTEFDREYDQRRMSRYAHVNHDEINTIRKLVFESMGSYNFETMLWDWISLDLDDCLDAIVGCMAGTPHKWMSNGLWGIPTQEQYNVFYYKAIELAHRVGTDVPAHWTQEYRLKPWPIWYTDPARFEGIEARMKKSNLWRPFAKKKEDTKSES